MSKTFWAVIAVIVVIFGGVIFFNKNDSATPGGNNVQPTNHVKGEGTSGVTLVEYADFQCPFCGQFYPIVTQVVEKYKDRITFQYRHLPLIQIHQHALAAARATEAADKQGKFWEMYDIIFQNQTAWSESDDATKQFESYATQLGLDLEKYKQDAYGSETNSVVNADINEFKKTKEPMSTPTFFLDGKKIQATSVDEFSKLIDEAIAAKNNQQQQ